MVFRICLQCGAHLDPGERCDCQGRENAAPVREHQCGTKVDKKLPQSKSTSILSKT